ncbi:MAG: hypothetical protein HY294_00310 [Candidatus Rokubacteria bacterium]|nr:hypothetical protein [Candidatus Rokubacteria bacterium]
MAFIGWRSVLVAACVVILVSPAHAASRLSCEAFTKLAPKDRAVFLDGVRDGFGAALGLLDSFSRRSQAAAPDVNEARGMHSLTQSFLAFVTAKPLGPEEHSAARVARRCVEKPDQLAARAFVDVVLGLDQR